MKRIVLFALIVALVAGGIYFQSRQTSTTSSSGGMAKPAAQEGEPAPDFELRNLEGQPVRLSDLRGKVVLVNFWATWCPPCVEEIPSMDRLYQLMQGKDFEMLALNVEQNGRSTVPGFLKKTPATFPILFDEQGDAQQLYGVYRFPETFIIDKEGVIQDKIIGGRMWDHKTIVDYLEFLIAGGR